MNCYGRFEDKHGMFSIIMKLRDEPYPDKNERIVTLSDGTIIKRGLCSSRVFGLTINDIHLFKQNNIDRVVFFFDVDSLHSSTSEFLSLEEFLYGGSEKKAGAVKSYELLIEHGFEVYYRPIVWAAETLLLQQFCINDTDALNIYVHEQPLQFHQKFLSLLLSNKMPDKCNELKEIKNTYLYTNKDSLLTSLGGLTKYNSYNSELAGWLINGCKLDSSEGLLTFDETKEFICGINSLRSKLKSFDSFILDDTKVDTSKSFELVVEDIRRLLERKSK